MTAQLTIIGLGKIGASMGLALAKQPALLTRTGNDIDHAVARQALKIGAVDRIQVNLPASVEGADIILLALPVDQVRETLKVISRDVKENAVVMDTSPCKSKVHEWVREMLPEHCHHVSLAPVLNPAYLEDLARGIDSARADLFEKGLMGIAAEGEAIKLAADFAALLGSVPLFADLAELDGLLSAVHTLPALTSAALVNMLADAPGWTDRQKLAGNRFAAVTAISALQGAGLHEEALANREHLLHLLADLVSELNGLREELEKEDEGLKTRLESAARKRREWLQGRKSGNWLTAQIPSLEIPRFSDHLKQMVGDPARLFGSRRRTKKKE